MRPPREAVEEAIDEAYEHKPSMLQDVLARRATEIDVLNGGIAAEGRRAGVPTPAARLHGGPGQGPRAVLVGLARTGTAAARRGRRQFVTSQGVDNRTRIP